MGTIVTEIPKGDQVWRIEADIFGPVYADFIGEVESSINSFTLISNESPQLQETAPPIPSWIKNNAKWWSDGKIGDSDFVQGIQFLIKEEIVKIPKTAKVAQSNQKIPDWIKSNAGWWADGKITDDDFVKGIQYLISVDVMKV